ncbi:hypothetical protein KKP97_06280 [Methanothermococcus sp. SCGC AD-155-C09]|nr:hypothetical protein [Methanothermococcus sp. SCGC AD-155-C09]
MKKRLYIFITPDGITYSPASDIHPDVDNLQVLGFGEGFTEEEAFNHFIKENKWVLETGFKEIICLETKMKISESKIFFLK